MPPTKGSWRLQAVKDKPSGTRRAWRLFWRPLAALGGIVSFLFAVIAVNQEQVSIRFLTWRSPEWSLYWWLLIAFMAGAAVGAAALLPGRARVALRIRRLRKALDEAKS